MDEVLHEGDCKCEGCMAACESVLYQPCLPPQDNVFDLTIITKQLRLNADILMKEMSEHAEKLKREIKDAV